MSSQRFQDPFEFAGYFFAHATWSIDGSDEVLTTIGAEVCSDGSLRMARIEAPTVEESVDHALAWLEDDGHDSTARIVIYDGYVPIGEERCDALIGHLRDFEAMIGDVIVTIAYRRDSSDRIHVVQKTFGIAPGLKTSPDAAARSFQTGIERHADGLPIWRRDVS
ncbi:MAG: hypothetical protein AAF334_06580 [Pseudomonadota bacterium]